MAKKENGQQRQHKATYARDKRNPGKYNIRIQGPHATVFEGRVIPVTRKDNSEENEKLLDCFWAGNDEDTGQPVALYHFEPRPREENQEEFEF